MKNNFIFLLLLISNIAVSQVYWFYQTERKLGQFGNYNPPSNDTVDYDTIYIDWTGFANLGADPNNDPSFNMYWNRVDLQSVNSLPPDTLLTYVYSSAQNDTLGPLIRTSDSSDFTTWFNDASSNIYSGWPDIISLRGVRTNDTLSFSLAGFEPNQQITFRIFGGSQSGATSQRITIGDSVNVLSNFSNPISLSLAFGTADEFGNLSFSICCPQPSNFNAYWKGMEIITGFVEPDPEPEPPVSLISARVMDESNIDLFTDDNARWDIIYDGDVSYENHYFMDPLAVFDQRDNYWEGTEFKNIQPGGVQRGFRLNSEAAKFDMRFPWEFNYWLKQPIQIDSIGFLNYDSWGGEGQWDDLWFTISGATTFGDWTILLDTIRGTNTDEMVWQAINTTDSIKYLRVMMDKVDRNGISTNVFFNGKLSLGIIGDKGQPDTLPDLPENFWKTGLTYRERLTVNDLQNQEQEDIEEESGTNKLINLGTYFSGHRFYDNLANFHLRSPGRKWIIEPNAFSSTVTNNVDARGDTIKTLKWYSSDYLSDRRNGGSNFNLICLQRGWKLALTDDFSATNDLPIWKNNSYTYGVRDTGSSSVTEYTTTGLIDYDYRDTIFKAWHDTSLYVTRYDTALLSNLTRTGNYLGDTTLKVDALDDVGFPFENPLTWVNMADPKKRDSIMTAPETWTHMAELFFCMSAIYGDVAVPVAHVDQYLEPGQLYTTGMGVLDAISKHQEPNKDWEGIDGYWRPRWVAMFLSVAYDGHLGTVCDTCGIFAADSSMYISYGGDVRLKGSHAIETWEWLMYFRQQVWDTLSSKLHPYSGDTMRLAPKIHIDTHHYFSTTGGQGSAMPDFLKPDVESTRAIEPEHPFFWEESKEFLKWANANLPKDARIELSEYGYGPNSGAPHSVNKNDIKITAYGTDWWPTAALSGGTGADSIDMGLDAYAVALEKRAEQLFWRHGWPFITKFQIRDPSYSSGGTLNGGPHQPATDSAYWKMSGFDGNRFSFMGVFRASAGALRVSDQTYHWLNVAETMKDYELWEIETETDTVYSYIWRSTIDTTKYIKRVWRPTIVNDTTYNYTVNFPASGTSDVVQINCYLHSFDPVIDSLGNITSHQTDIIEIEKMFGYTYVPVGGDTVSFVEDDISTMIAEKTIWQNFNVLSEDDNTITDWVRKSNNDEFFRYEKSKIVDWSDAGMMRYLLSGANVGGDEYPTWQKVKSLIENGEMP